SRPFALSVCADERGREKPLAALERTEVGVRELNAVPPRVCARERPLARMPPTDLAEIPLEARHRLRVNRDAHRYGFGRPWRPACTSSVSVCDPAPAKSGSTLSAARPAGRLVGGVERAPWGWDARRRPTG